MKRRTRIILLLVALLPGTLVGCEDLRPSADAAGDCTHVTEDATPSGAVCPCCGAERRDSSDILLDLATVAGPLVLDAALHLIDRAFDEAE